MVNNKKADNFDYDKRKKIYDLDDKIYNNKKKIKELTNLQESLISIDFYINDCIDLLFKSIKSEKNSAIYNDIQDTNRKKLVDSLDIIEKNVDTLKKTLSELNEEKTKEIKKQDDSEIV